MANLVGLIMPFFIDLVNRKVNNSRLRFVIALLSCILVGALLNLQSLSVGDISEVIESGSIIFAQAQVVYKLYWENSALRARTLK